jgi:uncharacterized membrane protein
MMRSRLAEGTMLAPYHPIVVHFAVALLVLGTLARLLTLVPPLRGRLAPWSPAATALLLLGTVATLLAVASGHHAEDGARGLPGIADVLHEHEEWGERARNVFVLVALAELAALGLARVGRERYALFASAALAVLGSGCLVAAGNHGGQLVYSWAAGVGVRSGDPADVGRLLRAGLYQQMQLERRNGRSEEAALLAEFAQRRFPGDLEVGLLAAESLHLDRRDAAAALRALEALPVPKDQRRLRVRHALLTAEALRASGQVDGARALLQALLTEYPGDRRLTRALESLSGAPTQR